MQREDRVWLHNGKIMGPWRDLVTTFKEIWFLEFRLRLFIICMEEGQDYLRRYPVQDPTTVLDILV